MDSFSESTPILFTSGAPRKRPMEQCEKMGASMAAEGVNPIFLKVLHCGLRPKPVCHAVAVALTFKDWAVK